MYINLNFRSVLNLLPKRLNFYLEGIRKQKLFLNVHNHFQIHERNRYCIFYRSMLLDMHLHHNKIHFSEIKSSIWYSYSASIAKKKHMHPCSYLGFALSFPADRFFKKSLNFSLDAPSRCPPTDQHNEKKNKDCSHWMISLSEREGRSLSLVSSFSSVSSITSVFLSFVISCSLQQKITKVS